jgi:hypothetical protein
LVLLISFPAISKKLRKWDPNLELGKMREIFFKLLGAALKMHAMFIRFSHRHPVSTLGREEYFEPPPVFCSLSSSFWSVADPLALQQVADGIPRSLSP